MTETASDSLAYSRRHTWVQADPETHQAFIGITDYLADTVGLIVSVDLPQVDDELEMDAFCAQLHLSKRILSLRSPLTGRVLEVNEEVQDNPSLLSLDPYRNWLYRMEYDEDEELELLMGSARYARFVDAL
ncbi:MAG: glycine cleavage system protein H [Oligosphaeraceae bacterium]